MSALPPRRRVSLISVKLGPAHWTRVSHVTFPYLCKQRGTSISLEAFKRRVSLRECYWTRVSHVTISLSNANKGGLLSPSRPSSGEYHFVSAPKLAFLYGRSHIQLETHLRGIKRERHQIYTSICGCMHVCVCVYVYIYIYTWASTATLPRNRSPIYRKQKGLLSLLSLHAAWRVSFRECYSTPVSHVTIPLSKLTRGAPKASSHFVSAIELLFIT